VGALANARNLSALAMKAGAIQGLKRKKSLWVVSQRLSRYLGVVRTQQAGHRGRSEHVVVNLSASSEPD
jgi:hypothetical protein